MSRIEENPSFTITEMNKGTVYSLQPATIIMYNDGSQENLRDIFTTTTTYPYKIFHQSTTAMSTMMKETGYVPLYDGDVTHFWRVKGRIYSRLQDDNENYYHFAIDQVSTS